MGVNLDWVAGVVCVVGLSLSIIGLVGYGLWDVIRQMRGTLPPLSTTASVWWLRFFVRHPIAAFAAGLAVGIMAGHLMWPQILRV